MKMFKRVLAFLLMLILFSSLIPMALAESKTYIPTAYSTAPKASIWKIYKANLHYFYNQLNDKEKQAFSSRYDSIALGKPELWVWSGFDLSYTEYQRAWHALVFDTPELMLGDSQYAAIKPEVSFYTLSQEVAEVSASKLLAHSKKISNYWKKTKVVLDKIKKGKSYGKNSYTHQLALDRYMVKNCKYKLDSKYDRSKINYNLRAAFSVFVTQKAVCEGYARAAELALRYYGVPCIYVYGDANNGKGSWEPHAWNMVKLGKNWYHYDPTWNDQNDKDKRIYPDYLPYFNLTDSLIGHSHKMDKEASTTYSFSLPKANSSDYEYYKKTKQVLGKDWKKKLASLISKAKKAKKKGVGIRFSSTKYYKAAYSYVVSKSRNNLSNELYRKYNFKSTYWFVSDPAENRVLYFFWK